jgi:Domain of unknown function (DUF4145)
MEAISWTCPHCDRPTTITDSDIDSASLDVYLKNSLGPQRLKTLVIACPNPSCNKLCVDLTRQTRVQRGNSWYPGETLNHWKLVPESAAKVLPDYVPAVIVDDYVEACLIVDKSPKASATLARRCLQGMIRDFHGISKDRLVDEIKAIQPLIDPLTWEAVDAVRSIGNIGAHMEKDINLIVDVDEGEAKELIQLIELLINDWYVTRHNRQVQLESIKAIKAAKDAAKAGATSSSAGM